MTVLFCYNKEDAAGLNMVSHLLEILEADGIEPKPVTDNISSLGPHYIMELNGSHIFMNGLDKNIPKGLGVDRIVFLSRHRAASGRKALTVHSMGVFLPGGPDFGGKPGYLSPAMPLDEMHLLRSMKEYSNIIPEFAVSLEATHHGPAVGLPSCNFEIGSTAEHWPIKEAGEVQGRVLYDVYFSHMTNIDTPIAVGFGGGHYAPRFTDIVLKYNVAVGHIIPSYILDAAEKAGVSMEDLVNMVVKATPSATLAYFDRKALKSKYSPLKELAVNAGLEPVRAKDLEPLGKA